MSGKRHLSVAPDGDGMMPRTIGSKALTLSQGKALVHLICTLRRDWQTAGIEAAVKKAAHSGAIGIDVAVAAIRAAANPEARTPALIPSPGPHWQGTTFGGHQPPTMCGIHPERRALGCPECKATPTATPEQIKAARQRARQLATNPPTPEGGH